jgi:teichuronic acid biosynthesis glycosyltransferase TuaC
LTLRILVVTSQFPISGDAQRGRAVYQTVRELARRAEVTVVSPVAIYPRWARPDSYLAHEPDAGYNPPGVDTRYVCYPALPAISRPFNGYACARALTRHLRGQRYDVVLGYWLYPDAYGAACWANSQGVPLVAGARGSDIRVRDALSRYLTRRVIRWAQRLIVVSEDLASVARHAYGARPERTAVIRNGCDTSIFHSQDRAMARASLGIAGDRRLVLYVGRLVPEKGLAELTAAAAVARHEHSKLQVVLVGDGPMRPQLEELIARTGAPVQLAGAGSPTDIARWMAAADVVTLPSYSEGYPNVLVEALACGRPVVATAVGGVVEIVDADNSILVGPRDVAALANGLDSALSRRWNEQAIAAGHNRTWDDVADETLEQCRLALAQPSAASLGGRP